MRENIVLTIALTLGLGAVACLDGGEPTAPLSTSFAEVLPSPEDVALSVPADANPSALMLGETAKFYIETRHITRGVNGTVYAILSVLQDLVRLPPSEVGPDHAIWGPFTPALEPTTFMLTVHREGQSETEFEYVYALLVRPRTSTSPDDFVAVIQGGANPRSSDDLTGQGAFVLDWTTYAQLNPLAEFEGHMWVGYEHRRLQWRSVEMAFEGMRERRDPQAEPTDVLYRYLENADTSGEFQFAFSENIHDPSEDRPEKEIIQIRSRWDETGAGRADARVTGHEIAADLANYAGLEQPYVEATECWDDAFLRTFYNESPVALSEDDGEPVEGELDGPGQGDPNSCVFTDRMLPDDDVDIL